MNISNVQIFNQKNPAKRLATAHVVLGNSIVLYGIGIIKSDDDSLHLAMPTHRTAPTAEGKSPEYIDYYHPTTREARQALTDAVIEHYNRKTEDPNAAFVPINTGEPLEVEDVRVTVLKTPQESTSPVLAFVSVTLSCGIKLTGIRLRKRPDSEELFITMPIRSRKEDKIVEVYHPITREFRKLLTDAVVAEYQAAKTAEPAEPAEPAN